VAKGNLGYQRSSRCRTIAGLFGFLIFSPRLSGPTGKARSAAYCSEQGGSVISRDAGCARYMRSSKRRSRFYAAAHSAEAKRGSDGARFEQLVCDRLELAHAKKRACTMSGPQLDDFHVGYHSLQPLGAALYIVASLTSLEDAKRPDRLLQQPAGTCHSQPQERPTMTDSRHTMSLSCGFPP
jgi:hypothetical protein